MAPISALAFQNSLTQCFQNDVPRKVLLALSGGADSMCLAHLLAQYRNRSRPDLQIHALTIDHGFRVGSASEAVQVGRAVAPWGIRHHVRKLQYSQNVHDISNFEEVARDLRYQQLRALALEHGISAVLVGHNSDDRLETFLQRLQMNSTLYGLNALAPKAELPISSRGPRRNVHVFRPLLGFDKSAIRETCISGAVPWFEDASNSDIGLTKRNLLRYMICDYVPQNLPSRPDLECLSRASLTKTTDQVAAAVEYLGSCETQLHQSVQISFDRKECKIRFSVSQAKLAETPAEAVARWLYKTAYPLSSAKHFHWSYAKLERKAIPRITKFASEPAERLKFTYLKVVFDIYKTSDTLSFTLTKQPPERHDLNDSVALPPGKWVLFDRTWWIRVDGKNCRAVFYRSSMKKKLLEKFPTLHRGIGNVPVVLDSEGNITAVPTHNLSDGLSVGCFYKNEALE